MSNEKFCCFTGHRNPAKADLPGLKTKLEQMIESLICQGVSRFLNGGAVGFDALCAEIVLDFKQKNEAVKLVMILPCRDQDKSWSEKDKAAYKDILAAADETIYVSEEYFDGCMKLRNIRLVEESDFCIAYVKRQRSGSAQTMRLAQKKGIPIFNLAVDNPEDSSNKKN